MIVLLMCLFKILMNQFQLILVRCIVYRNIVNLYRKYKTRNSVLMLIYSLWIYILFYLKDFLSKLIKTIRLYYSFI